MDHEALSSLENGYVYKGMYRDVDVTNRTYKVYSSSGGDIPTIYLFKVGDKTVEILGPETEIDVLNKILQTMN